MPQSGSQPYIRRPVAVTVQVTRVMGHDGSERKGTPFSAQMVDLSQSGMRLATQFPLGDLDLVLAEFTLPGGKAPIQVSAIVRNRRADEAGLEFVALSDEGSAELHRYLSGRSMV